MPKRRRRSFTPQFKAQVVLEVLSGLKSQAEIARQHKLKPELAARWKDIALEGLEGLFQSDDQRGREQERTADLLTAAQRRLPLLDLQPGLGKEGSDQMRK